MGRNRFEDPLLLRLAETVLVSLFEVLSDIVLLAFGEDSELFIEHCMEVLDVERSFLVFELCDQALSERLFVLLIDIPRFVLRLRLLKHLFDSLFVMGLELIHLTLRHLVDDSSVFIPRSTVEWIDDTLHERTTLVPTSGILASLDYFSWGFGIVCIDSLLVLEEFLILLSIVGDEARLNRHVIGDFDVLGLEFSLVRIAVFDVFVELTSNDFARFLVRVRSIHGRMLRLESFETLAMCPVPEELLHLLFFVEVRLSQLFTPVRSERFHRLFAEIVSVIILYECLVENCARECPNIFLIATMIDHWRLLAGWVRVQRFTLNVVEVPGFVVILHRDDFSHANCSSFL